MVLGGGGFEFARGKRVGETICNYFYITFIYNLNLYPPAKLK